jgi:hypothetical protein
MKEISMQIRNVIFFVLVAFFAVLVANVGMGFIKLPVSGLFILGITSSLLGLVLVVLTARLRETRIQKIFFILTGASAAGILLSAILHNLVYALLIFWFGKGFWEPGGDEAFFFILAIFVCPALFVIGSVGSIVLFVKARIAKHKNVP